MSTLNRTLLITVGLLGASFSVGASQALSRDGANPTDANIATVRTTPTDSRASAVNAPSLYDEAFATASALRGVPAASAVGRPVSLELIASLLRAASFGAGPTAPAQWTLFLPTDTAFAHLAGAPLDALIHHPNARQNLLDRHVVVGALSLDELQQGESVTTLGGQPLDVVLGDMPRVNGATVLAEQRLGNAHVYIVDGLL